MSKLNIVSINKENAYEVIRKNIYNCITEKKELNDIKFHHQLDIKRVPLALQYGLLSYKEYVNKVENRSLTPEEIFKFSDEYHVNGLTNISLSSMQLDFSDKGKNEFIWDTFDTINPDIIVSKDVNPRRVTINYYNEFIVENEIQPQMFNAVDIRLLKIINYDFKNKEKNENIFRIKLMLEYYEWLRNIAITLKKCNLDIPLRETSEVKLDSQDNKSLFLDKERVIELPKLILK